MKTLAASTIVLLTLCAPALGDPVAPPASLKVRFAIRDTTTTHFDVVVSASRCATASEKRAGRELQMSACLHGDDRLDVEWFTRSPRGEYRSTSTVPATPGATTELGSASGPHLTVTVQ